MADKCNCGAEHWQRHLAGCPLYQRHTPTSPDPLALSESEKFFRHLNNGEVYLKADVEHLQDFQVLKGYRITITEKGLPA